MIERTVNARKLLVLLTDFFQLHTKGNCAKYFSAIQTVWYTLESSCRDFFDFHPIRLPPPPPIQSSYYLNALYSGRYQHINEHGVISTKYTIDSANPTPDSLLTSSCIDIMKYPRLPRKFRNSTAM